MNIIIIITIIIIGNTTIIIIIILSNVFDILVCLGVPWFLKTVVQDPGSTVKVVHRGLKLTRFIIMTIVNFVIITNIINYNNQKSNMFTGVGL